MRHKKGSNNHDINTHITVSKVLLSHNRSLEYVEHNRADPWTMINPHTHHSPKTQR